MKFSSLLRNAALASGIAAAAIISAPLTASAATFNFSNITGGDAGGDSIVGQFSFTVADNGNGKTLWRFFNTAGATNSASFISQIYFDWANSSVALSIDTLNFNNTPNNNTSNPNNGVFFTDSGVTPPDLPQGNNIGFNKDLAIGVTNNGANKSGIDLGQSLGVIFNSPSEATIANAINSGTLRVGIHVQGIAVYNGQSDAYVSSLSTTPTPVPVPGFLLGVVAASALGGSRLLKNKKQSA